MNVKSLWSLADPGFSVGRHDPLMGTNPILPIPLSPDKTRTSWNREQFDRGWASKIRHYLWFNVFPLWIYFFKYRKGYLLNRCIHPALAISNDILIWNRAKVGCVNTYCIIIFTMYQKRWPVSFLKFSGWGELEITNTLLDSIWTQQS